MLFREEHADTNYCIKCNSSRYFEVDRNGDGQKRQTTVAKNILRYLPVLPRIQRLFMTEDTAQQMRWAVEGNRYTDKMIHPSDTAWKNFVKKFPLKAVLNVEVANFTTKHYDPNIPTKHNPVLRYNAANNEEVPKLSIFVGLGGKSSGSKPYRTDLQERTLIHSYVLNTMVEVKPYIEPPPPNKDDYRRVDPSAKSVEFYQEEGLPGHFTIALPTIDDMVVDDEQEDAGMDGDNAEDEAEDVCAPEDLSLLEAFRAGIDLDADGPPPGFIDDYWFAEPDDDDETRGGGGGGEDQEEEGGGEDQEEEGGGEDQEEEDEEDLSEDEGLGNLVFDPDQSLDWEEPADYQYVPAVERLRPRDRKPYRRGITQLPSLKDWRYRHVVLVPYGRSSFKYEDPSQRPPRGLEVGALQPRGRSLAAAPRRIWLLPNSGAEGKENACDDVLHQLARKRVTGMHYEARVQCVRDWHADRFVHMTKEDARDTLMQPWQYMHNPPQYVGNDDRCFLAMVMWWTCPQYLKKHEEGKKKRAEMRGGSHIQGSIPLSLHLQNEEVRTGAKPNVFAVLKKMKQRKTPDPETGSVWVNPQCETQCTSYVSKFKQKYGEDANPEAEDFDPEVAVLAGEGLKHGRLWFGDGCVDPAKVPSLRQIHRGRGDGSEGAGGPGAKGAHGAADSGVPAAADTDDAADATGRDDAAAAGTDELADEPDGSVYPPGSIAAPPPYSMPWMPPPPTQTPGTPVTVNNMNIIRSMNRGPFAVDFWSLCRAHTHGKGGTWRSPVRLGAPSRPAGSVFAVRAGLLPHGKANGTAQRARTATMPRTAKVAPHGNATMHGKGLLERDIFDFYLPEFDKPWVIHLRETCCCSTNLCTWRPNIVDVYGCFYSCSVGPPRAEVCRTAASFP
ncbi:hypothetical protein QYE76_069354 [Lolium multiflorum]|uniref:Uncharacterized protein n=1 Tax=Lolium multiflorum TaxID=4521 RepID=A0AAD8SH35_LOLMU|nr:hypothetical protein QYE76_069354 [Lolium multiflorum]